MTCGFREGSLSSISLGPPPSLGTARGTAGALGGDRGEASGCGSISSANAHPSSGHARQARPCQALEIVYHHCGTLCMTGHAI